MERCVRLEVNHWSSLLGLRLTLKEQGGMAAALEG